MRFMKNYGKVASYAPAYAMNDEFSRVLHQQMEFFSSNPSVDTLNRVRGEVGEASIFSILLAPKHGEVYGFFVSAWFSFIFLFFYVFYASGIVSIDACINCPRYPQFFKLSRFILFGIK